MLRILAIVAVVAATAWGAYWFVGARALDRRVAEVLAEHPAAGAESYAIRGFPNRFDLTVDAPRIQVGPLLWQAPFLQVMALSYRPHHVIVVLPHDQSAQIAGHEVSLQSTDARASLVMSRGLDLPLERMTLVIQNPQLHHGNGANHTAEAARIATRSEDARLHDAVIEIDRAFPDPALMNALDPGAHLPRRFDVLRLEAQVLFDQPLDREALAGPLPRPVAVQITGGRARFEGVDIVAEGVVEPDETGHLSGPVTLTVTGWPKLLELLADAGMIDPNQAGALRPMLAGLAAPENPDRIEIELEMRSGALAVGPMTLVRIPALF